MKKLIISFMLALGLAAPAFAQVPPTVALVGPLTADQFVFTNSAGQSVPYDIVFTQAGIVYAVFDPTVSVANFTAAVAFLRSTQAATETNGAIVTPVIVANFVNTNVTTQVVRQLVDQYSQTSTTLTTISNLQTVVQAAGHYQFRAVLLVSAGGSGGLKVDYGGTATTSSVAGSVVMYGAAAVVVTNQTAFLSGPTGSTSAILKCEIEGEFDVGNGGTFVIQFAQNASNGTPTIIKAGSTLTLTQIP